jgi:transposase InsO family protein
VTDRRELTEVFDYIEVFYNPTRRHSTLDYLSPTQFELRASREEPTRE